MESAQWGGIYKYCVCCGKWDLGTHEGPVHRRKLARWKDDSEHNRIVWSVDYTKEERYGRETLSRILMEYEETAPIFVQACAALDAREGAGAAAADNVAGAPPPPPVGPPPGLPGLAAQQQQEIEALTRRVECLEAEVRRLIAANR